MNQAGPARILVVDDAEFNREVLTRILEREGYQVDSAMDGAEALEKIHQTAYDTVLLDVMMPGVDGVQVIEAMHADPALKRLPVIMLSALNEQDTVLKCIQLGAQDYLPKPINQQLLKARISACLERKRIHDLEREYTLRVESMGAQLQAMNEQLRQANRMKTRFLATAAHDLKNPLGGILLMADRIREEAQIGHVREATLGQATRIHDMVQKMIQIINSLLDAAVQELGEVSLSLEMTNLGDLVHGVVRENEAYAESKNIRLVYVESFAAECWGMLDQMRISQAMDNLVNNAVKYSPFGSTVRVELGLRIVDGMDRVHIEVQDQGPGLSAEDMARAFGPFQRLSAQPTGGEYSTGLGLSIVKQMVELHGGWVWIESQQGQGATFLVEIPLISEMPLKP
ncbi:hybrid sensor histidine kinase/response regulator [Geothrix sp. PMB-07]|uniref:hybrid sensor histidine kinase/response regulator n=1 Tax=Geothrix sp. PMB-07 TaxID=3068640 RepID=UPI002740773E|nr:hybrid sensor histidine kinase/response regulator [Geothrix sp. PMB-07]WLT31220.1 hybrid sensor histidine kinase/response regulator [Geothrix sp. PMB-07]